MPDRLAWPDGLTARGRPVAPDRLTAPFWSAGNSPPPSDDHLGMSDFNRRHLLATTLTGGAALAAGWTAAAPAAAAPAPSRASGPLRVHLVAFDGVEELDLFGPLEVFALAAALGRPVVPTLVFNRPPRRGRGGGGTPLRGNGPAGAP
ncbi:hypothetical protein ACFVG7_34050, partial [Streptomyces sp. NPDC127112]